MSNGESYYRVVSGSMRALVWARGYRQAIRLARARRNWKALGFLTAFQRRHTERGRHYWGVWKYVETTAKASK